MDDFRVGSVSPSDPYRDQESSGSAKRKKGKRPQDQTPDQDDVVVLSEQTEAAAEPVEDYFAPSEPPEEESP